jgi:regulator of protease activity HflC (stomatin/prohibitin superfamily)
MATIASFPFIRHLRGDPSTHGMLFKNGRIKKEGRGLSTWFSPLKSSLLEVPLNDCDVTVFFNGTSSDYQTLNVNASVAYRITDPQTAATRLDFSLHNETGLYQSNPLEKLSTVITQIVGEAASDFIATHPLKTLLQNGPIDLRDIMSRAMTDAKRIKEMGVQIISVGVNTLSPSSEMKKALQVPERERIQQAADEASFTRRAQAVENERGIQENELNNRIELTKQKEALLTQEGINAQREAQDAVEAAKIHAEAAMENKTMEAQAQAQSTQFVEGAKNEAEKERMEIYRDLSPAVSMGLAARELAAKLESIEHLSIAPDALGPLMERLLLASAQKLEQS